MAQFARPDSNVTQTSFTGGFADIDEVTASDADFAYGANNTAAELEVGLTNVTDPASSTGHVFRYRIAKTDDGIVDGGGNAVTVTARLMQGTTQIATDTAKTASGSWTQYAYTLSGAEADSITDYTDLRLEFLTSASGGSPANRRGAGVSWAELETPDAPAASARVEVSFAEVEVPHTTTRVEVSFTEVEVPHTATRVEVSFTELEVPHTATRVEVSFTEVEVPHTATRVDVSFLEVEVPSTTGRVEVSFTEFEVPSLTARVEVSFLELETPHTATRTEVSYLVFETVDTATRVEVSFLEVQVPSDGDSEEKRIVNVFINIRRVMF